LMRQDTLEELFEAYYSSVDQSSFWQLLDTFGNEKSDEAVFQLVLRLYDHARSHPEPELWLQQMAEAFECGDSLTETQQMWVESVLLDVRLELDGIFGMLK